MNARYSKHFSSAVEATRYWHDSGGFLVKLSDRDWWWCRSEGDVLSIAEDQLVMDSFRLRRCLRLYLLCRSATQAISHEGLKTFEADVTRAEQEAAKLAMLHPTQVVEVLDNGESQTVQLVDATRPQWSSTQSRLVRVVQAWSDGQVKVTDPITQSSWYASLPSSPSPPPPSMKQVIIELVDGHYSYHTRFAYQGCGVVVDVPESTLAMWSAAEEMMRVVQQQLKQLATNTNEGGDA